MEIKGPEADLGVIVGRFQTPYLTNGHCELIDSVYRRHSKILICLGEARVIPSKNNPLDFATRYHMIRNRYPGAYLLSIQDHRSDDQWSRNLDALLRGQFPHGKIALYGGRDSFIQRYSGRFPTVELESKITESATEARKAAFHSVRDSEDFRVGVCYATANRYPALYPTVDVAITQADMVLLGSKAEDGGLWRFLGGYINPGESAKAAARREGNEESGADIGELKYIDSVPINDWRYAGLNDGIFTTFFEGSYMGGPVKGADDVQNVAWFDNAALSEKVIVPEHHNLLDLYLRHKGIRGEKAIPVGGYEVQMEKF